MAYRIEENVSWRQMWYNLSTFLEELTTVYDISYDSATGDGIFSNLSVPDATATTEVWTLICTNVGTPAVFSVTGTVSGATASATVGTPYNNGIVKFTLTEGAAPWAISDIITFSTEETTSPPWLATTIEGTAPQIINRLYNRDGSEKDYAGILRKPSTSPKIGSSPFTGYRPTGRSVSVGYIPTNTNHPTTADESYTYWIKSQNPVEGNATYGELHPFARGISNYIYGPFGIGFTGDTVHVVRQTYNNNLQSDYYPIPESLYTGKVKGDWIFVAVVVNAGTDTASVYLDGTLITTFSIGNGGIYRDNFLVNFPISDFAIWNYTISAADIQNIMNDTDVYDITGVNVSAGLEYQESDVLPLIAVNNTDSNGNDINAVFFPQKAPYFSYNISASTRGMPAKGDFTEEEFLLWERDSHSYSIPNDSGDTGVYLLGGETNQVVSKTWFVATEDFIIVAYKIYDPTTSQQLPVYQLGYVGRTDTSEEMEYKAVMGTYASPSDYWYTDNALLRSGIFYAANGRFHSLGGYDTPTNIYYSEMTAGFERLANSYNVYPVTFYNSSYSRNFGELYNIYGVQVYDVNVEDEFTIDGERYIALGDGTRAGSTSLILLKLG